MSVTENDGRSIAALLMGLVFSAPGGTHPRFRPPSRHGRKSQARQRRRRARREELRPAHPCPVDWRNPVGIGNRRKRAAAMLEAGV